jgi:hypothetical protein
VVVVAAEGRFGMVSLFQEYIWAGHHLVERPRLSDERVGFAPDAVQFSGKKQMIVSDLYGCIEQFAPTRL